MPWRAKGRIVQKKVNGWVRKAKAKTPARAKRMVRLLYARAKAKGERKAT